MDLRSSDEFQLQMRSSMAACVVHALSPVTAPPDADLGFGLYLGCFMLFIFSFHSLLL